MPLITKTEAKARSVSELSANAATDTILDDLIARADEMIAEACGMPRPSAIGLRTMASATYTLYSGEGWLDVDPVNARILRVGVRPVTTITSVHEAVDEAFDSGALVASADYGSRGELAEEIYLSQTSTHGQWSRQDRRIKAVVVAGWATAPGTLKQAAAELVMHLYELRTRRGKTSIQQGNLNTAYRTEIIPDHILATLGEYMCAGAVA